MSILDMLDENAAADNELLRKNDEEGDVFVTPRDVDFAFKTYDESRARDLCEFINGRNLGKARVQEPGEDGMWWVVSVIHMPITQNVLCSVSGLMVCLSRLFQVEYDGWGSVIQSEKSDH